jgi:hypothetical protein
MVIGNPIKLQNMVLEGKIGWAMIHIEILVNFHLEFN